MVPDNHFGFGSKSEQNDRHRGCSGRQYTGTIHSGTVQWTSPQPSELVGGSAGRPAGTSVDVYNAHALLFDNCI